jgi:hypothetical protein
MGGTAVDGTLVGAPDIFPSGGQQLTVYSASAKSGVFACSRIALINLTFFMFLELRK